MTEAHVGTPECGLIGLACLVAAVGLRAARWPSLSPTQRRGVGMGAVLVALYALAIPLWACVMPRRFWVGWL